MGLIVPTPDWRKTGHVAAPEGFAGAKLPNCSGLACWPAQHGGTTKHLLDNVSRKTTDELCLPGAPVEILDVIRKHSARDAQTRGQKNFERIAFYV